MQTPPRRRAGGPPGLCGRGVFLAAAVAVCIFIVVAVVRPRVRSSEHFLSGFWVGDPAFLAEAGLADFYLYIAPCEGRGRRQGYLVMTGADGRLLSNQGLELSPGGRKSRWASALKSHFGPPDSEVYRIRGASLAYDDNAVMPETLDLGVSVPSGTLTLSDGEKLYAFCFKDNEASLSANAQFLAEA